jgi:hypothetical protein
LWIVGDVERQTLVQERMNSVSDVLSSRVQFFFSQKHFRNLEKNCFSNFKPTNVSASPRDRSSRTSNESMVLIESLTILFAAGVLAAFQRKTDDRQ